MTDLFHTGDRVTHGVYGIGTVEIISHLGATDWDVHTFLTVAFDDAREGRRRGRASGTLPHGAFALVESGFAWADGKGWIKAVAQ